MRIERRTRFAASFVAIVGCSGGPRTEPVRPPDPIATAPAIDGAPEPEPELPIDAAEPIAVLIDSGVDAYVPDRFNPPKRSISPCELPPDPGNPTCNPPSPTALTSQIVSVKEEGKNLVVIVGDGRRKGVDVRWHAELLTEGGKTIPAVLKVERVVDNATYVRVHGLELRLTREHRVRLSPP
ncbi:MAG: hypothetical protein H0T46_34635 [Deltaproteobacteria bacterium]|nr:hypothetical protein [Deltaproteobacteria bacterium]